MRVLAVNAGSASARFALYEIGAQERMEFSVLCEGIGLSRCSCSVRDQAGRLLYESTGIISDHGAAAAKVVDWIKGQLPGVTIDAVGHRLLHGGRQFAEPTLITSELRAQIFELAQIDPGLPEADVRIVRAIDELFPHTPKVACFDTAFHRTMPAVAQMLPLPRELFDQGVVRYGAHGISVEYVMGRLAAEAGEGAAQSRVVVAHLGCTASMTALNEGRSVDSTAGYHSNSGLMMGTHSGDLGPGVLMHLLIGKEVAAREVNRMVNLQSGLLGVSRVSRDMRELLKSAETNPHAAEAVALFCFKARKSLGSMAAVLGGLDTLVFTGGVGANAPMIRRSICEGLGFLGIRLDPARNRENLPVISTDGSPVTVRAMATNEEVVIARAAARIARLVLSKS